MPISEVRPPHQGPSSRQDLRARNSLGVLPRDKRPSSESIVGAICRWTVEHQVGLSINLLLLHALTHVCFPRARDTTRKFVRLSYHDELSGRYAAGWDDFYMVLYGIVVLTGLRAATLDYILLPLAQQTGIHRKMDRVRFAEQGWVFVYDSVSWLLGMYIMAQHEHWLNMRELWSHWPDREVNGSMKWYYLVQFSFWLQQIMIVNIEKRRKDHWQMFSHHVITCILMFTSYAYHWTKVGNLILCLMDNVDIFLALAKMLKYMGFRLACDAAFGVFMLVWFATRHVLYLNIIVSIFTDLPHEISYGCYSGSNRNLRGPYNVSDPSQHLLEPFTRPEGTICFTPAIKWAFTATLLSLQAILLIWFGMIIKVAFKVLRGGEAEDCRSDDEDIDEEELAKPIEIRPAIEEEVSIDALRFASGARKTMQPFLKSGSGSSGVSLRGDHKELLGRIGCDGNKDGL